MHSGITELLELLPKEPTKSKNGLIPIFSFLSQLLSSFKEFCQSDHPETWIDFIVRSKRSSALTHFIQSWVSHCANSLECQLLGSLSMCLDRKKLHLYSRLRKYIVQLMSKEYLDEITLKHEDTLTIIHRMFPSAVRKQIARGVKQLFIGFKVAEAKIYSCVFIEFILSVYDNARIEEQSLMIGDTKMTSNIQISNFSSIVNFSSNLYKQNVISKGHHPKTNYQIIEAKFLPHELERRKTHFGNESQESYYYSNSLNFTDQNSFSKQSTPQGMQQEKQNVLVNRKSLDMGHSFEFRKQILIEESNQNSCFLHQEKESRASFELKALADRNRDFKNRMLQGSHSYSSITGGEESISETINIIHNSVVRNHHYKQP